MKNYQLIEELMKLPAGYDIEFYRAEEDEIRRILTKHGKERRGRV